MIAYHWIFMLLLGWNNIQSLENGGPPLSVVTYNIRLDVDSDEADNWHHRKNDMVHYIDSLKPDFLGLQEALHHQLTFLDDGLIDYAYIGVARDDGIAAGEYSPILYDSTRWSCLESGTLWLSETPEKVSRGWDAACNRVLTYGFFRGLGDQDILVCNTHLDHVGVVAREESVNLILSILEQKARGWPTMLMGDFNLDPSSPLYGELTARLEDAALSGAEINDRDAGTFNGFKTGTEHTRRIDYIFTTNGLKVIDYKVDHPLTSSGRQVSDHFPVSVKLIL